MMARLGISRETLPQKAGEQPPPIPRAQSHEAEGVEWEVPGYDDSNFQMEDDTVADFRPMQAATSRV
jgi:hypothetical protein